jgi:ABC-type phosphate transport system substrate-binding protein
LIHEENAMNPINHRRFRWLWLASSLLLAAGANAQVVVVTAKSGGDMSKEQVSDVFLGRASSLPGGAAAQLFDQPESSPLRDEFYSKVTGKSAAQAKSLWSKLAFTGKGTPPKEAANSAEIKKAVASTPGGIGYIEKSAVDDSVKVVLGVN